MNYNNIKNNFRKMYRNKGSINRNIANGIRYISNSSEKKVIVNSRVWKVFEKKDGALDIINMEEKKVIKIDPECVRYGCKNWKVDLTRKEEEEKNQQEKEIYQWGFKYIPRKNMDIN